jgi:hypothetical protein
MFLTLCPFVKGILRSNGDSLVYIESIYSVYWYIVVVMLRHNPPSTGWRGGWGNQSGTSGQFVYDFRLLLLIFPAGYMETQAYIAHVISFC